MRRPGRMRHWGRDSICHFDRFKRNGKSAIPGLVVLAESLTNAKPGRLAAYFPLRMGDVTSACAVSYLVGRIQTIAPRDQHRLGAIDDV